MTKIPRNLFPTSFASFLHISILPPSYTIQIFWLLKNKHSFLQTLEKKLIFPKFKKKNLLYYIDTFVFFLKVGDIWKLKKNLCHHFNHPCLDNNHLYICTHTQYTQYHVPPFTPLLNAPSYTQSSLELAEKLNNTTILRWNETRAILFP